MWKSLVLPHLLYWRCIPGVQVDILQISHKTFITKQASGYWLQLLGWELASPPVCDYLIFCCPHSSLWIP